MFYLIYVSSAVKLMDDDELIELLRQSRAKNQRLEITGMLLYKGGNFMQMLEGRQQTVLELYATICADVRHKGVITVQQARIAQRNFPDWTMGFQNMDKIVDAQFEDYIRDNLTLRSFAEDAQNAYHFMVQFNRFNR